MSGWRVEQRHPAKLEAQVRAHPSWLTCLDKQIRTLRESSVLSQEALARNIGVAVRTVARWESGTSRPSPLAIEKLNQVFAMRRESGETLAKGNDGTITVALLASVFRDGVTRAVFEAVAKPRAILVRDLKTNLIQNLKSTVKEETNLLT
jgi:DNA-binding transcriptional regulator YiaG